MSAILATPKNAAADALRILIVDDSEPDVAMLSRMLRHQFGPHIQLRQSDSAGEALQMIERETIDVALVDYLLPDMDGLEVLSRIAELCPRTATILLTGQGNERVAAQAIKDGARDYLVKRDISPSVLERAVSQAVSSARSEALVTRTRQRLERSHTELDHCVRSLSHDMSANFMILESSFRELKKSADQAPSLVEGVTHIEACLRQSQGFLDDLMTLAKTGSVDMEPARVELISSVQEVLFEIEPLLLDRDVRVIVGPDLPAVWCNSARTKQAISNLVRNAVKHGCDPRRPEIRIDRPSKNAPTVPAGHVWLEVYDNGPGIPAASRDEVFLPGQRLAGANSSGTGMGLAIVRKIVEHYGGVACVHADCPSGTRMLVSFPLAV